MPSPTPPLPPPVATAPQNVCRERPADVSQRSVLEAVVSALRAGRPVVLRKPPEGARTALPQDFYELPHVDDDTLVSPIEKVEIPSSVLRRGPHGEVLPESDRVRIIESPYSAVLSSEREPGTRRVLDLVVGAESNPGAGVFGPVTASTLVAVPQLRRQASEPSSALVVPPYERELVPWLAFEALHSFAPVLDGYAGRRVNWGNRGQLTVDLAALAFHEDYLPSFYSGSSRTVAMGGIPAIDPQTGETVRWNAANSRDALVHEAGGHAALQALKPHLWLYSEGAPLTLALAVLAEDLGDQAARWSSLERLERREALYGEVGLDLRRTSALTKVGEGLARLDSSEPALRDAAGDLSLEAALKDPNPYKVSEVFSQAAQTVFASLAAREAEGGAQPLDAMLTAARVMGTLAYRSLDYLPENSFSISELFWSYAMADRAAYGGEHLPVLMAEYNRRGLIEPRSQRPLGWPLPLALPALRDDERTVPGLQRWVNRHAQALGISRGFSASVTSVESLSDGRRVAKLQLRFGKTLLQHHGNLVFDPSARLEWANSPLPGDWDVDAAAQLIRGALSKKPKDLTERLVLTAGPDGALRPLWVRPAVPPSAGLSSSANSLAGTVHDRDAVLSRIKK